MGEPRVAERRTIAAMHVLVVGGHGQIGLRLLQRLATDEALRASGLDYTILRPGRLTDESGSGCVALAASLGRRGSIARDDVAATLAALLGEPGTIGLTLEVLGGEEPVEAAVARV